MSAMLKVDELLREARERTGLADFGPDDFRDGLTALVHGLNTDARISASRLPALRERLLRLLMNRLWFARDLAAHPEIRDEDLGVPTVISSLPRTASTKLHRMLGASEDFQTPRPWQVHMFARIPGEADGGRARRVQETRAYEKWIYEVSPEMLHGHPVFTDEPEEDMMLSEHSFRAPFLCGIFDSDHYVQWLMQADLQPMYDYLKLQLQYLQWQEGDRPRRPWLLKTPVHFGNEHWLVKLFGQARFVVTHRDPARCIPSIASTTLGWRKLYSETPDSGRSGDSMIGMFAYAASEHLRWREANPQVEILDLAFDEITRDGASAARKVYDFLGLPLSAHAVSAMRDWERRNGQDKHGTHRYSADEVGLSQTAINEAFAPYKTRFAEWIGR